MEQEETSKAEIEMKEKIVKRERKTKKRMPQSGKSVLEIEKLKEKREQEESEQD